jgi:hypothetical protein
MTLWIVLIVAVILLGAISTGISLLRERTKRKAQRDRWQQPRRQQPGS